MSKLLSRRCHQDYYSQWLALFGKTVKYIAAPVLHPRTVSIYSTTREFPNPRLMGHARHARHSNDRIFMGMYSNDDVNGHPCSAIVPRVGASDDLPIVLSTKRITFSPL